MLELVAEGLSNRQIGERLWLTQSTVNTYMKAIHRKLGVKTRGEAAAVAWRARVKEAERRN